MSKIALIIMKEYQGPWKHGQTFQPDSTGILACLKNQVKKHSKIDNSVNNQKFVAFDGRATFKYFVSIFKPRITNHQI